MLPGNEFNLRHTRLVEVLINAIDEWPAEIGAYDVRYESFGSWMIVIHRKGKRTKIVFDGRDRYLEALRLQPDAGDFSRPPKHIKGYDFATGLTEAAFDRVLEFIREVTD
jgi:hypothetical protein